MERNASQGKRQAIRDVWIGYYDGLLVAPNAQSDSLTVRHCRRCQGAVSFVQHHTLESSKTYYLRTPTQYADERPNLQILL